MSDVNERLAEIEARAKKAWGDSANAVFIAHAHTDIPWLIEQLCAARADRDTALAQMATLREALGVIRSLASPAGYVYGDDEIKDRAEAALSATAPSADFVAAALQQWQPIETAPKDEMVILYAADIGLRWLAVYKHPRRRQQRGFPTHWTPLPKPPEKEPR